MAIDLTLKSADITAMHATPPTLRNPGVGGVSKLNFVQGYIASVTASLTTTSIIRLVKVPAHCKIKSIKIYSAAQAAGAFDIGLYQEGTATAAGTVIDVDMFASAVSCASIVQGTEVAHEAAHATDGFIVADRIKALWDAAGVSTEPAKGTVYEICATCVTTDVTTGTGALGVEVLYID